MPLGQPVHPPTSACSFCVASQPACLPHDHRVSDKRCCENSCATSHSPHLKVVCVDVDPLLVRFGRRPAKSGGNRKRGPTIPEGNSTVAAKGSALLPASGLPESRDHPERRVRALAGTRHTCLRVPIDRQSKAHPGLQTFHFGCVTKRCPGQQSKRA